MANRKQEELVEIVKFTPIKAQILIQGYGGETYAGKVERKIYDYFAARKLDIKEFASSSDNEMEVPVDMMPFPPGSAYECDNLWQVSGAELSVHNRISVVTEKGDTIWEHDLGQSNLEASGVTVTETASSSTDHLEDGTVVHWGAEGEKGCFFDAEIMLRLPFDPNKLEIFFENCDGWHIIQSVVYDGEEVDGGAGYSTRGTWSENKWIIVGEEEVYEPSSFEDVPELGGEEMQAQSLVDESADRSLWWGSDIRPERRGVYEVYEEGSSVWADPQMAEWTGRSWKRNGKKIVIKEWRGLNYDPAN